MFKIAQYVKATGIELWVLILGLVITISMAKTTKIIDHLLILQKYTLLNVFS